MAGRRRRIKPGQYGTNLRVVSALFSANRIEEVTVASDGSKSLTKLINEDQAGEADIQENVSATYTANGTYEVQPWPNKDGMEKATVTVDVPIEERKDVTIDVSTYTEPVDVDPAVGNTAIEGATVTLTNIPVMPEIESNKSATIDVAQYAGPVEITPTDGKDAMEKATVALTNIPAIESNKAATIDVSTYDDSNRPVITPDSGYDGLSQATIALTNIPVPDVVQMNKDATVDVSTYDPANKPVIAPDSGYDAMAQSTITLTNVPPSEALLYKWTVSGTNRNIYTNGIPGEAYDGQSVRYYTYVAGSFVRPANGLPYYYNGGNPYFVASSDSAHYICDTSNPIVFNVNGDY